MAPAARAMLQGVEPHREEVVPEVHVGLRDPDALERRCHRVAPRHPGPRPGPTPAPCPRGRPVRRGTPRRVGGQLEGDPGPAGRPGPEEEDRRVPHVVDRLRIGHPSTSRQSPAHQRATPRLAAESITKNGSPSVRHRSMASRPGRRRRLDVLPVDHRVDVEQAPRDRPRLVARAREHEALLQQRTAQRRAPLVAGSAAPAGARTRSGDGGSHPLAEHSSLDEEVVEVLARA